MPTASRDRSRLADVAGAVEAATVGRPMAATILASEDIAARLQACIARGLQALDPLAVLTIEAMLRRAAALDHHVRAVVEAKALRRLDAAVARLDASNPRPATEDEIVPGADSQTGPAGRSSSASVARALPQAADPPSSPLRDLLDHIAGQQGPVDRQASSTRARAPARAELKALTYFQSTWAALSMDRRLRQSMSALPENAGPLNSQRLVHRALEAMRELSPAYLDRFIEHVDTLLWLDDAGGGLPPAGKAVLHVEADKPARKRPRRKAE